jgi:ABC-type multidrug transport system ATPase subunit
MTTSESLDLSLLEPESPDAGDLTSEPDRRVLLVARDVSLRHGDEVRLHETDLEVEAGELVAIAGPSGAGKTTLLKILAGVIEATGGEVSIPGTTGDATIPTVIGYVPQDDIVPVDLTVDQVLRSAAEMVLHEPRPSRRERVDEVLRNTGLSARRDVTVRDLSGGERKRVNVAIELLTRPRVLLLDEPTSGLDPGTASALLGHLRTLTESGSAAVLTTHAPEDIRQCDRVVLIARGGEVVYDGPPANAPAALGVTDLASVYSNLDVVRTVARRSDPPASKAPPVHPLRRAPAQTSPVRQWWALTKRSVTQLRRNRLTLAVLVGSPALVTAMMVLLFSDETVRDRDPMTAIQLSYWLTFAAFFFGLTYGLLQIVTEMPVLARDRRRGIGLGSYLGAKAAALLPILAAANATMLAALRLTGRLPTLELDQWLELGLALALVSVAALATGLFASAAVHDATQATLALPMICFPQVLFAGLLVPVANMTGIAGAMSNVLVTRWGFEAVGKSLGVGDLLPPGDPYSATFAGAPGGAWIALIALTLAMTVGTIAALRARTS